MKTYRSILVLMWFFFAVGQLEGLAFQEDPSDDSIVAQCEILTLGKHRVCKLDLGDVYAGQDLTIFAELTNKSANELSFSSVSTSCRCTSVSPKAAEIPAFGIIELKIRLKVPNSNTSSQFAASFSLLSNSDEPITVNLFARTANNLHIEPGFQFAASSDKFIAHLPIEFSKPIEFTNLRLQVPEALAAVSKFKLVSRDGLPRIQLIADKSKFASNYVFGNLILYDLISSAKVRSDIILHAARPVSISPSVIQFRRVDQFGDAQKEQSLFEANAIMRVNTATLVSNGKPKVRCKVADTNCKVELRKINKNLYKVKLLLRLKKISGTVAPVVWQLRGDRPFIVDGAAMFK